MSVLVWIALAALLALVTWLGLALAAMLREHAALRERVDALEASIAEPLDEGLPIGGRAPPWSITTPEGDTVTAASISGRRHLLVFADPDCRACDDLVPEVARASADGALPPAVIVGRGDRAAIPASWRASTVGVEHDRDVSEAFRVDVSPYVFVVDGDGAIVNSGGAVGLRDVEELVAAGTGGTVVGGADG